MFSIYFPPKSFARFCICFDQHFKPSVGARIAFHNCLDDLITENKQFSAVREFENYIEEKLNASQSEELKNLAATFLIASPKGIVTHYKNYLKTQTRAQALRNKEKYQNDIANPAAIWNPHFAETEAGHKPSDFF